MSPAVEACDVTVRRDGATLLDSVSIKAAPGALMVVVGPNGAGKTTLLRVLAGDILPTSGVARVLDREAGRTSADWLSRARAYVGPQQHGDVLFTAREVVEMGRYPHRRATLEPVEHDGIIEEAMRQTEVAHLADRVVRDLSTGELQRVSIARALAQQTPVMLLDEPAATLDVGHQEIVMRRLKQVSRDGGTVVVVLHDLNLAAAHADQMLLLDAGHSIVAGAPDEVLTEEHLTAAYRQPMTVVPHPHRRCPLVLTMDEAP